MSKKHAAPVRPATEPDAVASAYASTESEIIALAAARVGRVTTDIPQAVALALGALPTIESLRADMEAALKSPPLAEVGRLRVRAQAALYAHLRHQPQSTTLAVDLEEARVLREQLLAAADAHVAFGHIDADAVVRIREGSGHLDRANDLIALSALFRLRWDIINSRTVVAEPQLGRASALGVSLIAQLGAKDLGVSSAPSPSGLTWADARARAFRLLMDDYSQIERAVGYLRWDTDDAQDYAPSLHMRTRRARPEAGENEELKPASPTEPTPG